MRILSTLALLAAVGACDGKRALPRGLEKAAPGAASIPGCGECMSADFAGNCIGGLRCRPGFDCFDGIARAIEVEHGISTVIYRNDRASKACVDHILREPPPRWTLLGFYECGDSPTVREAYYAIDGRWGARIEDHSAAAKPYAEAVFIAEPDLRADARRARDRGCRSLPQ